MHLLFVHASERIVIINCFYFPSWNTLLDTVEDETPLAAVQTTSFLPYFLPRNLCDLAKLEWPPNIHCFKLTLWESQHLQQARSKGSLTKRVTMKGIDVVVNLLILQGPFGWLGTSAEYRIARDGPLGSFRYRTQLTDHILYLLHAACL